MAIKNPWISNNARQDFIYIFFPGLLGIALCYSLAQGSFLFGIVSFLILSLIDSGHVYITFWRTWANPKERKRNPIYWVAPIFIATFFGSWMYFNTPHLWNFVIYATAYHHIRQYYGFMKWYEVKNKKQRCFSGWFFYMLAYTPILIYHFRSDVSLNYYTPNDFLVSPDPGLYSAGIMIYGFVIASWLIYEVGLFAKGYRELSRFLSVLIPGILYGVSFCFGTNTVEILFPLVLGHGIPYYLVLIKSLKHQDNMNKLSPRKIAGIVIMSGLFFGILETSLEEGLLSNLEIYSYILKGAPAKNNTIFQALAVGLYLVPLFSHFIFDALIWRKWHPEAQRIYSEI